MSPLTILFGDCREVLRSLPDASAQMCVTSPPYWGLRSYLAKDDPDKPLELGNEPTYAEFVANLVEVFREVRRVLKPDGTCWVNLGDSYAGGVGGGQGGGGQRASRSFTARIEFGKRGDGLKPKDLVGIPWRVAFALQADGWWLRQDIIWHKPNPMPESVTDRCTKAHEYLFLLTKAESYFYNAEDIKEAASAGTHARLPGNVAPPKGQAAYENGDGKQRTKAGLLAYATRKRGEAGMVKNNAGFGAALAVMPERRNKRSVWTVPSAPYSGAHFATYPPDLIKPCILAGSRPGDVVLDPFGGSGTTGAVAIELGRRAVLIELNRGYEELLRRRCDVTPGLRLETGGGVRGTRNGVLAGEGAP